MKNLFTIITLLCLSSLSTLNAQLETIVTGLDVPSGISVYNDQLYFTQLFGDEVNTFDLEAGNPTVETLANIDSPGATFVFGDDLYLGNGVGVNSGVYRFNLLETEPEPELIVELSSVSGVFIQDSVLYIASDVEQSVFSLDLTDENASLQTIASGFNGPTGMTISNNILYVTEFNGAQVSSVDLADNSVSVYLTDFDRPSGIAISNGLLYIADNTSINRVDPNEALPAKTLVVDGLDQTRYIAFRGPELYIVEAIGIIGTGRISRFDLPVELSGDSCLIALGIDSLFGGEIGEGAVTRLYDNGDYNPIGASSGTECFAVDGPEQTIWYRFTGDGNTYEIKTDVGGASDPVGSGDTRIAVYAGSCADLTPVTCNEDENTDLDLFNGRVAVSTELGLNYYFFIDAVSGLDPDGGEFRVEVTRLDTVSAVQDPIDLGTLVYPNPTDGMIYFQGTSPTHVTVLDATRRRVIETMVTSNQLDISTLPAGLYSLFAQQPDETWAISKVVKR